MLHDFISLKQNLLSYLVTTDILSTLCHFYTSTLVELKKQIDWNNKLALN